MPGLIRGVARTAVVAGTATAVSNRVSRRQANRWAGQQQQEQPREEQPAPAPAPVPAPSTDDVFDQLSKLGQLRDQGILTEEEFQAQKAKLLGS